VVLVTPFNGFSQLSQSRNQPFAIGVKMDGQIAGIANQNNYGQNEMDYGASLGYGGGVALTYHVSSVSRIMAEVTFQAAGQKYEDHFKGKTFRKEVRYHQISLPIAYQRMISKSSTGYAGVGSELKPLWFVLGGLQVDRILSPEVDWYLNGSEIEFLPFVLEGGNPNQEILEAMGPLAADQDLFAKWDVMFISGVGFQIHTSPQISFTVELRGGIGLTDLNAKDWQLDNHRGIYGASRNIFFGLHAGAQMLLSQ
jgi:hypothetical protein